MEKQPGIWGAEDSIFTGMKLRLLHILFIILYSIQAYSQHFERFPIEEVVFSSKKIQFVEFAATSKGAVLLTTNSGLGEIDGGMFRLDFPSGNLTDSKGKTVSFGSESNIYGQTGECL